MEELLKQLEKQMKKIQKEIYTLDKSDHNFTLTPTQYIKTYNYRRELDIKFGVVYGTYWDLKNKNKL